MGNLLIGSVVAIAFIIAILLTIQNKRKGGCSGCSGCTEQSCTNKQD